MHDTQDYAHVFFVPSIKHIADVRHEEAKPEAGEPKNSPEGGKAGTKKKRAEPKACRQRVWLKVQPIVSLGLTNTKRIGAGVAGAPSGVASASVGRCGRPRRALQAHRSGVAGQRTSGQYQHRYMPVSISIYRRSAINASILRALGDANSTSYSSCRGNDNVFV